MCEQAIQGAQAITALNIVTIIISILALLSSFYIGIKQTRISKLQMNMQNKVELYLLSQPIIYRDASGKQEDKKVPAIYIRNAGSNVVYLENYFYNGKEYPLGKEVLPSVASIDSFRYIELPTDNSTHVSFEINFLDWKNVPWKTKGFADFNNGRWELTYSPCERRKKQTYR